MAGLAMVLDLAVSDSDTARLDRAIRSGGDATASDTAAVEMGMGITAEVIRRTTGMGRI